MITVHHLNNSRSQRVLWLLEELGLEYQVERYQRDPVTMLAPPALRAVHPLGKSPVISDDGLVVAESGAIIEYLVGRYGAGRLVPPPGTAQRLRYTYWLHYAEGSAMPPLLLQLVFAKLAAAPVPFFVRPVVRAIVKAARDSFIDPQTKLHLDFIEAELGKATWFVADEFTAADIQMSFPLEAAAVRGARKAGHGAGDRAGQAAPARRTEPQDGALGPRSAAFLARIHARPAYQRALQRGGEFALAS